mmetsp:Transcript_12220/g.23388  ORF Transcript_12220/g.23388 Transcript_12220/m.23388 type:complete len:160 (-) Transcript_12220:19-498(-)
MKSYSSIAFILSLNVALVSGFVPLAPTALRSVVVGHNNMLPVEIATDPAAFLSSSMTMAETQAWVQPTAAVLDPFLNFFCFAMLARVVLSWYPETKVTEMPWLLLVIPTQPLLKAVKGVIPPAFGVDITPIFWLAIFSFIHEILLGQQGLLTMKIKYGI